MPDFHQPERSRLLFPFLIAFAALALAFLVARHFFPATTIDIHHLHTDAVTTHLTFRGSTVIGAAESDSALYIASRIRIDNQLRTPIYTDDVHLTLTDSAGAELTVPAAEKSDLAALGTAFPVLQPLLTNPLLRNTEIEPTKFAEGTLLFPLNRIPKDTWDHRRSAVLEVDIYHQPALFLTIPN